jgi:hypothetical protein
MASSLAPEGMKKPPIDVYHGMNILTPALKRKAMFYLKIMKSIDEYHSYQKKPNNVITTRKGTPLL